ncbi:MAG: hypothetical protein ACP5SI_05815 [Chloroflexia bacterium]
MNRKPKDRDFVETTEGLLFCIVGYLHPPDRYTAYLKYSPAAEGRWRRSGQAYHRNLAYYHAHQVGETLDFLEARYPGYVQLCPVRNIRFSFVPQERVRTYYRPEERLFGILRAPADPLEEEVARLAQAIHEAAGVALEQLGVTGSILLGIHDPSFSDIDLTVYGAENARRLRAALDAGAIPELFPLEAAFVERWCRETAPRHHLTLEDARRLAARRWNYRLYGLHRRYLSLHPTRSDTEIRETYGEHTYRDIGVARLSGVIADAAEAIFLPARYRLERVRILDGPEVPVQEICSYEGLFCQAADEGEQVEAQGKLEEVDGGSWYRLVIGSSHRAGAEYLRVVDVDR